MSVTSKAFDSGFPSLKYYGNGLSTLPEPLLPLRVEDPGASGCPLLFTPRSLGLLRLRTSTAALPLFTAYASPDGHVSSGLIRHYSRLAASGAGLVVVANAAVSEEGRNSVRCLKAYAPAALPGLTRLANAIRSHGAVPCLQLNHAGRFGMGERKMLPAPLSGVRLTQMVASLKAFMESFPFQERFGLTGMVLSMASGWDRGMTGRDRSNVADAFARSAENAYRAGFEAVELHGASGYLLAQHLSGWTNPGLGFSDREGFVLEVFRAVKGVLPDGFPIGFRLMTREWTPEGVVPDEAFRLAADLAAEGAAWMSVAAGTYDSMFLPEVARRMAKPAYLREDAREVRRRAGIPVIAGGRVVKPRTAEDILMSGDADIVGLGRPLLADPHWLRKAAFGEKPVACVNCGECIRRIVRNQGVACARWPETECEAIDLEHEIEERGGLDVRVLACGREDMRILTASLPALLSFSGQERVRLVARIDSGGHELSPVPADGSGRAAGPEELPEGRDVLAHAGRLREVLGRMLSRGDSRSGEAGPGGVLPVDFELRTQGYFNILAAQTAVTAGGSTILVRNESETWRNRFILGAQDRTVVAVGVHPRRERLLVSCDLSTSTPLLLRVLQRCGGCRETVFAHVLEGPRDAALDRWRKVLELAGLDSSTPLMLLAPVHPGEGSGAVGGALVKAVREGDFGHLAFGRRGWGRVKRFLLGSVARVVMEALPDRTFTIVS